MGAIILGQKARKAIGLAVDKLFDRVKARYLGPSSIQGRSDKQIKIGYVPQLTLQGLYETAAREEYTRPDPQSVQHLADMASGYLDLARDKAKLKAVHAVESCLRDADASGVKTDLETVLGGHLADVWASAATEVKKIVDTEATKARNLGTLEGITKVNAASGIEDPVVFFVTVRDSDRCEECTKIHLLPDEVTPRVWYLSEVQAGYHERGVDKPCLGGLHPSCRCSLVTLMPGYGFDKAGLVTYRGQGHNEMAAQRG